MAIMNPVTPKLKAFSRMSAKLLQLLSDGFAIIYGARGCSI